MGELGGDQADQGNGGRAPLGSGQAAHQPGQSRTGGGRGPADGDRPPHRGLIAVERACPVVTADCQRSGRKRVGEHVDQQHLTGVEHGSARHQCCEQSEHHLAGVAAEQHRHRGLHALPKLLTLVERGEQRFDVAIEQQYVGRSAGRIAAAARDRDPHAGGPDCRGVVGAVTDHRGDLADALECLDHVNLVLRRHPGEDQAFGDGLGAFVRRHRLPLGSGDHLRLVDR